MSLKIFICSTTLLVLAFVPFQCAYGEVEYGFGTGDSPLEARANAIDEARFLLGRSCVFGWVSSTVSVMGKGRTLRNEYWCRVRVSAVCNSGKPDHF